MFTQEQLEAAFAQMQLERQQEWNWANKAAQKLCSTTGVKLAARQVEKWGKRQGVSPASDKYEIVVSLCQYDDWDATEDKLAKGCKMDRNNSRHALTGEYDLTDDPEFTDSKQKKFKVVSEYYDSHIGGW